MAMRKSRLSGYKQARLTEHFVAGTTARTTASLCGVKLKTAALYFHPLREIIAFELEAESEAIFSTSNAVMGGAKVFHGRGGIVPLLAD